MLVGLKHPEIAFRLTRLRVGGKDQIDYLLNRERLRHPSGRTAAEVAPFQRQADGVLVDELPRQVALLTLEATVRYGSSNADRSLGS